MWTALLRTDASLSPTVLRLVLGLVIFPHGAQKLLGWFGGFGFSGTMGFFTQSGIPYVFALLAIIAEFFGGIGLILGLLTRVAAFGVGTVMVVAVFVAGHLQNGFFMNWTGKQAGEGFEYHILAAGIALALILAGGGRYSIDRQLTRGL